MDHNKILGFSRSITWHTLVLEVELIKSSVKYPSKEVDTLEEENITNLKINFFAPSYFSDWL